MQRLAAEELAAPGATFFREFPAISGKNEPREWADSYWRNRLRYDDLHYYCQRRA
jgi:hypothetical protein